MTKLLSRIETSALRVYQAWSSTRLPRCRYVPSCSSYAVDALQTHGFIRGNRLIIRRLLRCQPWGGWGADPVPHPPLTHAGERVASRPAISRGIHAQ